ncbi:MAG: hypothetical protein KDE22_15320 [Rhodobacterales bacterium]|nr:hypothetical protein [Rhodobacterales bacterium]
MYAIAISRNSDDWTGLESYIENMYCETGKMDQYIEFENLLIGKIFSLSNSIDWDSCYAIAFVEDIRRDKGLTNHLMNLTRKEWTCGIKHKDKYFQDGVIIGSNYISDYIRLCFRRIYGAALMDKDGQFIYVIDNDVVIVYTKNCPTNDQLSDDLFLIEMVDEEVLVDDYIKMLNGYYNL